MSAESRIRPHAGRRRCRVRAPAGLLDRVAHPRGPRDVERADRRRGASGARLPGSARRRGRGRSVSRPPAVRVGGHALVQADARARRGDSGGPPAGRPRLAHRASSHAAGGRVARPASDGAGARQDRPPRPAHQRPLLERPLPDEARPLRRGRRPRRRDEGVPGVSRGRRDRRAPRAARLPRVLRTAASARARHRRHLPGRLPAAPKAPDPAAPRARGRGRPHARRLRESRPVGRRTRRADESRDDRAQHPCGSKATCPTCASSWRWRTARSSSRSRCTCRSRMCPARTTSRRRSSGSPTRSASTWRTMPRGAGSPRRHTAS